MKKLLFLLLLFSALGAALYQTHRSDQELAEKARLQQQQEARLTQLESELAREKRRNQSGIETQRQLVDSLKTQYAAEAANLEALQQRFDISRNQGLPGGEYISDLENKVRAQRDSLASIDAQIKSLKLQESDVGKQSKIAQDQQKLGNQQYRNDLEAQIHRQELQLSETGAQAKLLKDQGAANPDGRAQLKALYQQLKDQRLQLQALKDQRPSLTVQGNVAVVNIEGQSQDQRTQLRLSREQLEERYRSEKGILVDLQKQLDDAKRDQGGQKQAYARVQADLSAEREKAQTLKSRLAQEEKLLRSLQGD